MNVITISTKKEHEVGTFAEYKKKLSIQERAKAAYTAAIRHDVVIGFDALELQIIKKIPVVL